MAKIPKSKPQASRADIEKIIKSKGIDLKKNPVVLVGVRGYYLDTMGVKGKNDRGIYDDALFWYEPDSFLSFNGNTDPSRVRKGSGKGSGKGMASLKPGVWPGYYPGMHNGSAPHLAFRQGAKVTVVRDGLKGDYEDTGMFGINIHRGGASGTSSLGCQTIPPAQWPAFKAHGDAILKKHGQKNFIYILITEEERQKIGSAKVTKADVVPPVQETAAINLAPALEVIKKFEGFYGNSYLCPAKVWTIGWGTTRYANGEKVKKGQKITRAQAEAELMHEVTATCLPAVMRGVKVKITNNELCALVSFIYNVGSGAFANSTLLKKLNAGVPRQEVAKEFHRWNKGGGKVLAGLVRRRVDEAALFLK